jgi:hypothetical protein
MRIEQLQRRLRESDGERRPLATNRPAALAEWRASAYMPRTWKAAESAALKPRLN